MSLNTYEILPRTLDIFERLGDIIGCYTPIMRLSEICDDRHEREGERASYLTFRVLIDRLHLLYGRPFGSSKNNLISALILSFRQSSHKCKVYGHRLFMRDLSHRYCDDDFHEVSIAYTSK